MISYFVVVNNSPEQKEPIQSNLTTPKTSKKMNTTQPYEELVKIPGTGYFILASNVTQITKEQRLEKEPFNGCFYVSIDLKSERNLFIDDLEEQEAESIVNFVLQARKKALEMTVA